MKTLIDALIGFWRSLSGSADSKQQGPWPRTLKLLSFARRGWWIFKKSDDWSMAQFGLNVIFIGGPGAGKTSAMESFVRAGLRANAGAVGLVYKKETARDYERFAKQERRDIIMVRAGATPAEDPTNCCNILDWEINRHGVGGAVVEEIAYLISEVISTLSARYGNGKGDDEWQRMAMRLLKHILEIQISAYQRVDLRTLIKLLQSLPSSEAEVEREGGFKKQLQEALILARQNSGTARGYELDAAEDYLKEWASLSPRTTSSILTTLMTALDSMNRYPLRQLFFDRTTFTPDDVLKGKVCILDLPVDTHGEIARIGAILLKTVLYRCVKARDEEEESWRRPVMLLADEMQAFCGKADAEMANVSRAYRLCILGATQNLPNLLSAMGGDSTGAADVDSLVSNLQLRVVTLTNEEKTMKLLSELLGKVVKRRITRTDGITFGDGTFNVNSGGGYSEQVDYEVQPRAWSTLRAGGPENNMFVEAVVMGPFYGGRKFRVSERRFLRTKFDQTGKNRSGAVRIVAPRISVNGRR